MSNMKKIQMVVGVDTYSRFEHFKGAKTWGELFISWLNHFEGFDGDDDDIKYITCLEWNDLNKRLEKVENR